MDKKLIKAYLPWGLCAGIFTIAAASGLFYEMDNRLSDALYQERRGTDGRIAIVGIDQRSLEALGPFGTWDRRILAQTVSYLKELFAFAISERDRVSGNRYGSLIDTAKQYLAEHFESNDVSLNTVAAQVGVSSSYFSSIFKQETGQSFVEYLTKLRIDKACELLRCTTLRTAEIGERVGYNDPHYFSATFKKVTGVSPKDYKNGGQEPERRTV